MQPRVISVETLSGYRLALTFDDGTEGIVDCNRWLYERDTGVFAPLRDPDLFAQVRVNPELGVIEWPTGADVDPYVLYDLARSRIAG